MQNNHIEVRKHMLTVEKYHLMYEKGILTENDKVELINGELFTMSPIGSQHATIVKLINRLLHQQLSDTVVISIQDPIQIPDHSEPEPDIALLRPPLKQYKDEHPKPEDVLLIIEVSDTTINYDQKMKLPIYAQAEIPQLWIVNLPSQQVEVYTDPDQGVYRIRQLYLPQDSIELVLEKRSYSIPLEEILG